MKGLLIVKAACLPRSTPCLAFLLGLPSQKKSEIASYCWDVPATVFTVPLPGHEQPVPQDKDSSGLSYISA